MKIIIYILCIPIKLFATIICVPLYAFGCAISYTVDGENDIDIAKECIKDIWV